MVNGWRLPIMPRSIASTRSVHPSRFPRGMKARLAELLAAPVGNGLRPAGWYHSHTRSEIFLSDADQEIHRRFFPEPWQVALVLKPHTFHPTRAGFFFRGVDGGIHAETSYNEFVLSPLALKPGAPGVPATDHPKPAPAPVSGPIPFRNGAPPEPPPPPAAEPAAPAETLPLPKFLDLPQPRSRRFLKVTLALLAGFALGAAAYLTRDNWLPPLLALARPAPPSSLGLNTIDYNGQLQIRWNSNSAAVQQATGGALSIDSGGAVPQEISLDKAHLLSGVVTIARQARACRRKPESHSTRMAGPRARPQHLWESFRTPTMPQPSSSATIWRNRSRKCSPISTR